MSQLSEVLEKFLSFDGVEAVLFLNSLGKVIDECYSDSMQTDLLEVVLEKILPEGILLADKLGKNKPDRQHFQYGDKQIVVETMDNDSFLVIVAGNSANLGRVRLEIRKSRKVLSSI